MDRKKDSGTSSTESNSFTGWRKGWAVVGVCCARHNTTLTFMRDRLISLGSVELDCLRPRNARKYQNTVSDYASSWFDSLILRIISAFLWNVRNTMCPFVNPRTSIRYYAVLYGTVLSCGAVHYSHLRRSRRFRFLWNHHSYSACS